MPRINQFFQCPLSSVEQSRIDTAIAIVEAAGTVPYSMRYVHYMDPFLRAGLNPVLSADPKADGTNQTDLINQFFAYCLSQGVAAVFPPGVFGYTGTFSAGPPVVVTHGVTLDGIKVFGSGTEATRFVNLQADARASAWRVQGDGSWLCNLTIDGGNRHGQQASRRTQADNDSAIRVSGANNFFIAGVSMKNSRCAGSMNNNGSNGIYYKNSVENSCSDSYHTTNGASDMIYLSNDSLGAGDDGFSVVSYESNGSRCNGVKFLNNRVMHQRGGRGLTVIGGKSVWFEGNTVLGAFGAGISISAEPSYLTYGCENVTYIENLFDSIGTTVARSGADIPAVQIYAGRGLAFPVSNIKIKNNKFSHIRGKGFVVSGLGVDGVEFEQNSIVGRNHKDIISGGAACTIESNARNVSISKNDIRDVGGSCVVVNAGALGKIKLHSNDFLAWNYTASGSNVDAVVLQSASTAAYTTLEIVNNKAHVYTDATLAANAAITVASPKVDTYNKPTMENAGQYPGSGNWPLDASTVARTIKPYAFQYACQTQSGPLPVTVTKIVSGNQLLVNEAVQTTGSFAGHGGWVVA
jgi:hypothetical protein